MYNRIIKLVLEPMGNIPKRVINGKKYLHISVGFRSEKILQNQSVLLNENIIKIKNNNAKKMLELISIRNPYSGINKMTFIAEFLKSEKKIYPNNVILLRNGYKYECFDIDSVLLVEHCGLEFLGNTPQVEFPVSELEIIIDKLLEQAISVNVYEDVVKGNIFTENNKYYHLSKIYSPNEDPGDPGLDSTPSELNLDVEILKNNMCSKVIGLGYGNEGYSMSILDFNGNVNIYENLNEVCVSDVINKLNARVMILQDNSAKIRSIFKSLVNVVHYHIIQGNYTGTNFHKSIMQEVSNRLNLDIDYKVKYFNGISRNTLNINEVNNNSNINYINEINENKSKEGKDNKENYEKNKNKSNKVDGNDRISINSENYLDNNLVNYLGEFYENIVFNNSYSYVKKYFKRLLYKYPVSMSKNIREINRMLSELNVPLIQVKNVYSNNNNNNFNVEHLVNNINVFKNYMENLPNELNEMVFELVLYDLGIEIKSEKIMKNFNKMYKIICNNISEEYFKENISEEIKNTNEINNNNSINRDSNSSSTNKTSTTNTNRGFSSRYLNNQYHSSNLINYLLEKQKMSKIVKSELIDNQLERVEVLLNRLIEEIYIRYVDSRKDDKLNKDVVIQDIIDNNSFKNIEINNNIIYLKRLNDRVNHVNLDSIQMVEKNNLINCYVNKEVNNCLLEYLNECSILNYKANQVINGLQMKLKPYRQLIEVVIHYLVTLQSLNEHVTYGLSNGWNLLNVSNRGSVVNRIKTLSSTTVINNESINIININNDKNILLMILLSNMGLYVPCSGESKISFYDKYYYYNNNGNNIINDNSKESKENDNNDNYILNKIDNSDKNTLVIINQYMSKELADKLLKKGSTVVVQSASLIEDPSTSNPNRDSNDYRSNSNSNRNDQLNNHYKDTEEFGKESDNCSKSKKVKKAKKIKENEKEKGNTNESGEEKVKIGEIGKILEYKEMDRMLKRVNDDDMKERMKLVSRLLLGITSFRVVRDMVYLSKNNVPPPRFGCVPVVYVLFMRLVGGEIKTTTSSSDNTNEDNNNTTKDTNNTTKDTNNTNKTSTTTQNNSNKDNKNSKVAVYVGETGDILTRLNKHKSRHEVNLDEYMMSQFVDYNYELNQYLNHLNSINNDITSNSTNKTSTTTNSMNVDSTTKDITSKEDINMRDRTFKIDFDNMNVLLLRLQTRKDSRLVEKMLIQELYNYPEKFIVISHRDGQDFNVPYLD